jgi:copper chaperone CopZ
MPYLMQLKKYIRSFVDGRVRIRHPALRAQHVADTVEKTLGSIDGVQSVECNNMVGSVLILYDSTVLQREQLLQMGANWAQWLDAVLAGEKRLPPKA